MSAEDLPEPAFEHLVMQLFTSGAIELGQIANPVSGETEVSLPRARFTIGMLEMLQLKTKGNLSTEESEMVNRALHGLRTAWLQQSREGA